MKMPYFVTRKDSYSKDDKKTILQFEFKFKVWKNKQVFV